MSLLKKSATLILAVCLIFQTASISSPFASAQGADTEYELYDYFLDVYDAHKAGSSNDSDSPWGVELRHNESDWGVTDNRTDINAYSFNSGDGYMYAYTGNDCWGNYPGYSFNTNYSAEGRLYLNCITPTNSGYGDPATNGWRINAAYVFTAPQSGAYTLRPGDQSMVYSYADCNYFHQWGNDKNIDFGVRITLNGITVWPSEGDVSELRDGFGVFGTDTAVNTELAVPTLSGLILDAGDKLRVEFTSFTPITDSPWAQRVCGTVGMTYEGAYSLDEASVRSWKPSELYLNGTTAIGSSVTLSADTVTNGSAVYGGNSGISFAMTAPNGFGDGVYLNLAQFGVKLMGENSCIYQNGLPSSFPISFPISSSSRYDISFILQNIKVDGSVAGTAVTLQINGHSFTAFFPEITSSFAGDFFVDNRYSGVEITLMGCPVAFKESSELRFDRLTNVIIIDSIMTKRAFLGNLVNPSSVELPDAFFTGSVVKATATPETYEIALRFDVNGDGYRNLIDLVRAKKCAAGLIEPSNAQILALTDAESYEITAFSLSQLRKRLLGEEETLLKHNNLIYSRASGLTSANLLGNWSGLGNGYTGVSDTDRNGLTTQVYRVSNSLSDGSSGMMTTVYNPSMGTYILSGYSRSENVTRTQDNEYYSYSLWASVAYTDGTTKEFSVPFSYGTHDWEYRENSFTVSKPASSITVAAYFRLPALGTAYFDDISLVRGNSDTLTFNDLPMFAADYSGEAATKAVLKTADGLKLTLSDIGINSVSVGDNDITSAAPSGFMVRDVASGSDGGVYGFNGLLSSGNRYKGEQDTLGISLEADYSTFDDHISVSGVIRDDNATEEGRAIELSYVLPVSGSGWKWSEDILSSRNVETGLASNVYKSFNENNYMSVSDWDSEERTYFPTAALYNESLGIAMAVSMDFPTYWELEYNGSIEAYVLTYHLGLTNEAPDSAKFDFAIYSLDDPEWGFRSAMSKYTKIHPDYYTVREKNHGVWLAWEDVKNVSNVKDFNIRYKEVSYDYRTNGMWEYLQGIKGYYYIEAGDWWISNLSGATQEGIWERIAEISKGSVSDRATMQALATPVCQSKDYFGNLNTNFVNNAWCVNGAQIHINANPALPGSYNFYNLWYNKGVKDVLFNSSKMKGDWVFDGIYLDELSGWWLGNANFNKEHYKYTTVPLTYSPFYKAPMLHRASNTWEFVKALADDLHASGKTIFANKCPDRNAFYTPLVDAMGTEQTALSGTAYAPQSIEQMSSWRTLAYTKSFSILLSNDYDVFNHEMMEKYFNRCLAYAIFPSPHDNYNHSLRYFKDSAYYERDRDIFKKYMPTLKALSEIGWEAVTGAKTNDYQIITERYGDLSEDGCAYIVLYNPNSDSRTFTVTLDTEILGISGAYGVSEVINGSYISSVGDAHTISVPSERSAVLKITL